MNSPILHSYPDTTPEQSTPYFAKELLNDAMAVALAVGAAYLAFCKWTEKAKHNHHRSELLAAYKVRHKWKRSDVKHLLSIGVNECAQRRMAKLEGRGRPVVKGHRSLEKAISEELANWLILLREDATPKERRDAIRGKKWPWWKHIVEALYRGERESARGRRIMEPHAHAEGMVADALRVSQGTVRAICGEVRAMRREDGKAADFPPMLLTEYERWMERGELPKRLVV